MEEQDRIEAKRAKNFIWSAAQCYDFEPLFLAFSLDGTADIYLNLIIGLCYKWYNREKMEEFFEMLNGKNQETLEGLFWIGLENAVYQKEQTSRSSLKELRKEYAQETVRHYRSQKEYSLIDRIRNGHCSQILGKSSGLKKEEQALLSEFDFSGKMTLEEMIEKSSEVFEHYFSYKPVLRKKETGIYFLQRVSSAFHSFGKVSATYVRTKNYEDKNETEGGYAGSLEQKKHYLFQFSLKNNPEQAKQYVEGCFGQSIYSEYERKEIEKRLCIGNHKNTHLLFTRGEKAKQNEESGEIREFQKQCQVQYEKNKEYFEKNRMIYENSARKLVQQLRIFVETQKEQSVELARYGTIYAPKVWQAVYLGNPRVFEKKEEKECPEFSVDILMDASSSRKKQQEFISAQACVLTKALRACQIPFQISSYCSIRGFTVMRIFKEYEKKQREEELFHCVSAGNNRDGLALRAAGYLMEKSQKEKKLLLVLTDASPQDDQEIGEGVFYKNNEYMDEIAVLDTEKEVHALRQKGIEVIGIFTGGSREMETAQRIFGRDWIKIQDMNQFSEAVGKILRQKLYERGGV